MADVRKSRGSPEIIEIDSDGGSEADDKFDGSHVLRCFVCPVDEKSHEIGVCAYAMTVGNVKRRERAFRLRLCFACLRRDCMVNRLSGQKRVCRNKHLRISCEECVVAANGKGFDSQFKMCPTSVLVCTRHEVTDEFAVVEKMKKRLGYDATITPVFAINSLLRAETKVNKANVKSGLKDHVVREPPVAYDTVTGGDLSLDNDSMVIRESTEDALYFLQYSYWEGMGAVFFRFRSIREYYSGTYS